MAYDEFWSLNVFVNITDDILSPNINQKYTLISILKLTKWIEFLNKLKIPQLGKYPINFHSLQKLKT